MDEEVTESEVEVYEDETIILPHTGQVLAASDTKQCANALVELRQIEDAIREVKIVLTQAIVAESQRQGTKTLRFGERKVEIRGGKSVLWDAHFLEIELRKAGMPEERIREIVKEEVSYKVDAREAKKAAGANPAYAVIVEAAQHVSERPEYAVIE